MSLSFQQVPVKARQFSVGSSIASHTTRAQRTSSACTIYSVEYFKKPYIKLRKSFPSSSSNVQKSNKLDIVVLSCVQYSASGSETSPYHQPKPITTDEAGSENLLDTIVTNSILLVRADTNRDKHDLPISWLINLECQGNLFYLD